MATIASESTKLGEVTRRGDRTCHAIDYGAVATYPLRHEDTHKKKRRLWGLFGGG